MMTIRMLTKLTLLVLLLMVPAIALPSVIHFQTDFDDGDLSGWTKNGGGGGQFITSDTIYAGAEGQSARVYSPDGGTSLARSPAMTNSFNRADYFSQFDVWIPNDAVFDNFTLWSGGSDDNIHGRYGPSLFLNDNNSSIDVSQDSADGGNQNNVAAIARETWTTVRVDVSGTDFVLFVDGNNVGTYKVRSPETDYVQFTMGARSISPGYTGDIYYDNITVGAIPEPHTALLMLGAGLVLAAMRHSTSRKA